jgi:tRNA nucleotidyltransferase (CCA-adding enzyme)
VAQFAARFDFDVDDDTQDLCMKLVPELKDLPAERIYVEIEKLLLKANKPSIGFKFLYTIGALELLFPELHSLQYVMQGKDHHSEGDALAHTFLALDAIAVEERSSGLMFAILFHDLGKLVVENEVEGDSVHFKGHAEAGVELVKTALGRLTNETSLTECVLNLVENHMRPYDLKKNLNKRLVRRLAVNVNNFVKLMQLHKADQLGRGTPKDVSYIEDMLNMYYEVKNEIKPLVKGQNLIELGLTPGKHFGTILKRVFEAQLDGAFNTVDGGLEWLKGSDEEHGCRMCCDWKYLYIKAGVPNVTEPCPVCNPGDVYRKEKEAKNG